MIFLLLLGALSATAAVEVKRPRGVSLTHQHFYDESKPFTCLDGSSTITFDQVNDDYCDCRDGSDEPGTAACPEGRFHCTNAGYKPQYIPSSRVNDGVCDCCDATDEYNSGIVCQNTCKEMGRKEREALQQMAELAREGFRLKKILIEEASKGKEEKQKKLVELQDGKKSLEDQVERLKSLKEEAEKPEKEAKETHLKLWEEQKAAVQAARDQAQASKAFQELDDNADGVISVTELQTHPELDPDDDGTLTEAEAQALLGEAMQADPVSFQESIWATIKKKYRPEAPPSKQPSDKVDEDEAEEKMPPYDERTQSFIDAAQKAREHFEEAEKSLKEMEESIRSLEQEISFDFGPSGEFAYLYNQCYELTTNEYIYRLCPFSRVSQKPKHGGSETNLGTWGSWAGPDEDKFSVMKYEHGTGCWQGPNRSTRVKLLCGKETVVASTTEPSRCEYLMEFITPAVCQEPFEPSDHDEL
ncbi:glucosidase 2 subunit beta isoform X2 [Ornithorhynchus anatinus]|uniref:Glucosidase 2 subunit beta n=1 Tax=Ornithorhynchus anatinus TaxID=9258 RepID=F6V6U4_ORNAN|nr:glucosidase 2 subunit beta isoform X2 [Ornithorhynchus anatinus]